MRQVLGLALVSLGVLGTLLPIVPGIPLLLAGAAVLGPEHRLVRPVASWLRRRAGRPVPQGGPAAPPATGEAGAQESR